MQIGGIGQSRQYAGGPGSVASGLSKAKSHASIRLANMDSKRATAFNSDLALKLSYEWKNIYRTILQGDILQKGKVTATKFNQALLIHNVVLNKEEIRRLVKLSFD